MNTARVAIFVVGGLVLLAGAIGTVVFLSRFFVSPLAPPAQEASSPMPSAQMEYYFQNEPPTHTSDGPRLPVSEQEYDTSTLETIIDNNQGGFGQY